MERVLRIGGVNTNGLIGIDGVEGVGPVREVNGLHVFACGWSLRIFWPEDDVHDVFELGFSY